jgi:oligopeptide/dipeptide ABC transporter ATP-binding protein
MAEETRIPGSATIERPPQAYKQNDSTLTPHAAPGGVDERRAVVLRVEDLNVRFRTKDGGEVHVVRDLNYEVRQGETLVIVGESGSGKSVSARAIIGLLPATASATGKVLFEGQNLMGIGNREWRKHRGTHFGMVFQDPSRSLNPTMRIGRQIGEALRHHFGMSNADAVKRSIELLDIVGIPSPHERIHEYPYQLSGGMRQRVMMAIAISCNPKVLIADEPTTALDVTIQAQIMELLGDLQRQLDMGLILITHDMGLAFTYGDDIAVMYGGRIVERAPANELETTIRMPYTKGLLDSVPQLSDTPHSEFKALTGRPADPATIGPGCSFAPRCVYAQDRCSTELPPVEGDDRRNWQCWYPL